MARNPLGTCERSEQGAFLSSHRVFRSHLLSSVFNPEGTRERSEQGNERAQRASEVFPEVC